MESGVSLPRMRLGAALPLLLLAVAALPLAGCGNDAPPTGSAIANRDSIPVMTTRGVTKLVSDSGVVRYKIISEEWRVYDRTRPPRQEFPKGLVLQRFDNNFGVDLYITADTAWCYDQKLWELRGRVLVKDFARGTTISTEELYWDMGRHELYSNVYTHVVTPERELKGNWFRANEAFTKYHVKQTSGYMPMPNTASEPTSAPAGEGNQYEESTPPDTPLYVRPAAPPRRKERKDAPA